MEQEHSELFHIRINERGEKYIRRFAAISYTMLVLLIFISAVTIYWNIRFIVRYQNENSAPYQATLYDQIFPYVSSALSLLAFVSNLLYLRFPRKLLNSIKTHDEYGANEAFSTLFNGALLYMMLLFFQCAWFIWALVVR